MNEAIKLAEERYPEADANFTIRRHAFIEGLKVGEGKWVSVEDKLPDNDAYSLCYIDGDSFNQPTQLVLVLDDGEFWDDYGNNHPVTHWQPLPSPPKTEI